MRTTAVLAGDAWLVADRDVLAEGSEAAPALRIPNAVGLPLSIALTDRKTNPPGERWGGSAVLDVPSGVVVVRSTDGHPASDTPEFPVSAATVRITAIRPPPRPGTALPPNLGGVFFGVFAVQALTLPLGGLALLLSVVRPAYLPFAIGALVVGGATHAFSRWVLQPWAEKAWDAAERSKGADLILCIRPTDDPPVAGELPEAFFRP